MAKRGIFEAKDYFYAFVEIARHPIGAAQIHLRVAAIAEDENPAVLEESADNAAHADVRLLLRDAGA